MKHLVFGLIFVVLGASTSAMSLREFRALEKSGKEGANYANFYLVGAMEAAVEAHQQGVRNGAQATICLKGRKMEPSMARGFFDAERKRNIEMYEADMPVQMVLLNALATVYSCA